MNALASWGFLIYDMIKINEIKINQGRRKVDRKSVEQLAESIKELGLLNAVTLNLDYTLIAGMHRIEAFKLLGYDSIEANVIDLDKLHAELAEIDENLMDVQLHWMQRDKELARRKQIYEEIYPDSKAGKAGGKASGISRGTNENFSSVQKSFTEDTANKTGQSQRNVQLSTKRAEKIDESLQDDILELDISKTEGSVLAKYEPEKQKEFIEYKKQKPEISLRDIENTFKNKEKKLQRENDIKEKSENLKDIPLPDRKYNVIYADPPWKYEHQKTANRDIENHYPTMNVDEICNINPPADDNCVLFLWVTAPKVPEAIKVITAWGFEYKTCAVWDKGKIGMGYWFRGQHELLFVATKGNVSPPEPSQRISSMLKYDRGRHSQKPKQIYEIIENYFYNYSKVEMFARNTRDNWDNWGNEL